MTLLNEKIVSKILRIGKPMYHSEDHKRNNLGHGNIYYSITRAIKPEVVVCIGSGFGFVPMLLAYACQDNNFGKCYFVDPHVPSFDGYPNVGYDWTKGNNFVKKIFNGVGITDKFITCYPITNKKFNSIFDKQIDILFIDDGIDEDNVNFNFYVVGKKVKKGGLIFIHDTDHKDTKLNQAKPSDFSQPKLIEEIRKQLDSYELLTFSGSGGFAIVRKLED